jgi:hypothetical protein
MTMRKLLACVVHSLLLAILIFAQPATADDIIFNNFDGDDANDTGGLFNIVSNPNATSSTTDPSTGLISHAGNNSTQGFSSSTAFDAQAFTSLTVVWQIDSVTNAITNANGWFFGLQSAQGLEGDGTTLWNQVPDAIGVNLFGNSGAGPDAVASDVGAKTGIDVSSTDNAIGDSGIADGFTVSLTLNDDNTYAVSSTGLTNEFDQNLTGAFPGAFTYTDFGNTTFAATTFQISGAGTIAVQVGSVTVTGTAVIPEPGSLVMLSLGLGAVYSRRRRRTV